MKTLIPLILILFATPSLCFSEELTLSKNDLVTLHVSNYVHGFKEFDTTVVSFDDSVSVGIYYDINTQSEDKAEQLAARFRKHLRRILNNYDWGTDIEIVVKVHSEDRSSRGF